jgi:hypothetical protein
MATIADVLTMLIPNGGWATNGKTYEDIQFIDCEPITKKQFTDGFAKFDEWQAKQDTTKATAKAALLERLGLTEDEAKLLLS